MTQNAATSLYHDAIQALGYATALIPQAIQLTPAVHIALGIAGLLIWAFGTYLSIKFNTPPPAFPSTNPTPNP